MRALTSPLLLLASSKVGGVNGHTWLNTAEVFNPDTNTWARGSAVSAIAARIASNCVDRPDSYPQPTRAACFLQTAVTPMSENRSGVSVSVFESAD